MEAVDRRVELEAFVAEAIEDWAAMHPHQAINVGMHRYDGQIADWRPERISAHVRQLSSLIARGEAFLAGDGRPLADGGHPPWSDPLRAAAMDLRLVLHHARAERFRWDVWQPHMTNPLTYLAVLDVSPYVKRTYAPLAERVEALTRHCAQIPDVLAVARRVLRPSLPRLVLEQSIAMFEGLARFHEGDLIAVAQRLHDADRLAAFYHANRQAISAYQEFTQFLRGLMRRAHDEVALRADLLQGMIATAEGIDLPLDRLLALGMADLDRNHARIVAVAGKLKMAPGAAMQALGRIHPPIDQVIPVTRRILDHLRTFIHERQIVSIPGDLRCIVQETPPFMRTGSAFMDAPGPLEPEGLEAYYYLTLPDPSWPANQREAWLAKQSIPGLTNTSIHEALPGHYLQFLHLARTPSLAARLFTCTSFTEGWAHYAEQMMVEAGYHAEDPRFELQQVSMALLRDCRLIVALRLHTEAIAISEAADFIARSAFFSPIRARQEAIRGARDPSYLNYTIGKLLFLRLRADLRQAYPDWSLTQLHDTLLSCGAPPIPLLRQTLLGPGESDLFPA